MSLGHLNNNCGTEKGGQVTKSISDTVPLNLNLCIACMHSTTDSHDHSKTGNQVASTLVLASSVLVLASIPLKLFSRCKKEQTTCELLSAALVTKA